MPWRVRVKLQGANRCIVSYVMPAMQRGDRQYVGYHGRQAAVAHTQAHHSSHHPVSQLAYRMTMNGCSFHTAPPFCDLRMTQLQAAATPFLVTSAVQGSRPLDEHACSHISVKQLRLCLQVQVSICCASHCSLNPLAILCKLGRTHVMIMQSGWLLEYEVISGLIMVDSAALQQLTYG